MDKKEMGLKCNGLVMSKGSFITGQGEEQFQLNVAIPGSKDTITVGVAKDYYNKMAEMSEFSSKISITNITLKSGKPMVIYGMVE